MSYFEPSIAKAFGYRRAMDEALWKSVDNLVSGAREASAALPSSGHTKGTSDREPTDFLDYAAYFDLELTPSGDNKVSEEAKAKALDHLRHRRGCNLYLEPRAMPPRITNFALDDYSHDQLQRMQRWWDMEPENRMAMMHASDEEFARSRDAVNLAMDYLRDAAPELHGEIEVIIRDIVLSRPDGSNLINYSGASSFPLWGAMTINAETQVDWIQAYRQIVHEAAHNLLFGIGCDQRLTLNDTAERGHSPIRADPRPIDGIFHAAFVSAREAYAFDTLLCRHERTQCLTDEDVTILQDLLEISVLAFWDAVETLRSNAQLSEVGNKVLADCEACMNASFELQSC